MASSWGVYGPPASDLANSVLTTRGWVTQESLLSRRTLNFLTGEMVWKCCEKFLGQSGFEENLKNGWRNSPRNQLTAFSKAFEKPYRFIEDEDADDDDNEDGREEENEQNKNQAQSNSRPETAALAMMNAVFHAKNEGTEGSDHEEAEPVSYVTTMSYPDKGRGSDTVDLRDPQHQDSTPPAPITRGVDGGLYDFLDVASRRTIYHFWYNKMAAYSQCRLTFRTDKLPALAGIAARVQAITHDQYLAGHWLRELERSLF